MKGVQPTFGVGTLGVGAGAGTEAANKHGFYVIIAEVCGLWFLFIVIVQAIGIRQL
jgi:hypothetical protein